MERSHIAGPREALLAAAGAKRKLGQEERKELRGGGVAGEPGGVGGGAPEPARGASKRGYTLEGRRPAESTARGGGVSRVAYHSRSLAVWMSLVRSLIQQMLLDAHDGR